MSNARVSHPPETQADCDTNVPRLDLSFLENTLGFPARMLQLRLFRSFYAHFQDLGVHAGAYTTLLIIEANPGVRLSSVSEALMVQRPNMTRLINALVKDGQVRKRAAKDDKRALELFLTPKGKALVETLKSGVLALEAQTLSVLSPTETQELLRLIQKVSTHLQASEAREGE